MADSLPLLDVAFWKDECNAGRLRASGDGGECVNFSGARWFSARDDYTVPGKTKREADPEVPAPIVDKIRRTRLQPRAWEAHQAQHRQKLNLTEETALGSLSPYFDPHRMGQAGVGHGNVSESYGQKVRWHQIALGITVGIPVDEWDDGIHVKNDQYIPYGDDYSADTASRDAGCGMGGTCEAHWSLAERGEHMKRWNYGKCRALNFDSPVR